MHSGNIHPKTALKASLLLFFIACPLFCTTTKAKLIDPEEYKSYIWNEKVAYFQEQSQKPHPGNPEIYRMAMKDPYPLVTLSALDSMSDELSVIMRKELYDNLKHKNKMIRWKSCLNIIKTPEKNDLRHLARLFKDTEWLARECSCKSVRLYPDERKNKKYFFRLISLLNEKNPNVLKELYITLKWYEDNRAFDYLYKRSFHSSSSIELVTILRELVHYPGVKVTRRLRQVSRYHKDFFVREEAKKLLKQR